jgi:hypothetical protein
MITAKLIPDNLANASIGNNMFIIAATIGIAKRLNYKYAFHDCPIYSDAMKSLPKTNESYPVYNVKWGYHELVVPDNVCLNGYFQSEKYFKHVKPQLIDLFDLSRGEKTKGIAVHVRRGDYEHLGRYHKPGWDYYYNALGEFDKQPIYVFSDEPKKARLLFDSSVNIVEGNTDLQDFAFMCTFENFIIANSTFSWWPAWMKGKKVVAPKKWFTDMDAKDIYAKGWKKI